MIIVFAITFYLSSIMLYLNIIALFIVLEIGRESWRQKIMRLALWLSLQGLETVSHDLSESKFWAEFHTQKDIKRISPPLLFASPFYAVREFLKKCFFATRQKIWYYPSEILIWQFYKKNHMKIVCVIVVVPTRMGACRMCITVSVPLSPCWFMAFSSTSHIKTFRSI